MNKTVTWWQVLIFTCALNILTGLVVFGFTRSVNGYDDTRNEIKLKADKTYVDAQDVRIENKVNEVKNDVDKTINRIDDNLKEIRSYILKQK